MRSQIVELGNGRTRRPLKVCIQAELALFLVGVHHPHLLVLPHALLKEVGLPFQGDVLHEVERVFHIVHLYFKSHISAAQYQ